MPSKRFLDLSVRESRPGGPWGHKYVLRVSLSEDTLVWDVKTKVLELKPGYDPAGARLYYLGVPMANCRSLKDYHVASMGTLHIMRGGQGCVEAGKSCICATQLQHVLEKKRKVDIAREEAEQKEQAEKLQMLVSASSREASLNRVLFLQVESVLLLASSRSVHNTKAAVAAVTIAEQMIKMGADPAVATANPLSRASSIDHNAVANESAQQLMKRLTAVLYPRFRKWPPLVVKLAGLVGVKPPRRREEETDVDEGIVLDEASGMDIIQVTEEDDDPQEVVGSENPSTHELDNAELLIRPLGIEPETAIVTADSSS